MKVRVTVMPKASVLDPQGVAIRNTLRQVGVPAATAVRAGKVLEIELEGASADDADLRARLETAARDFLSNPVIEDYRIEVV
ncbi:MAG: phosphoribosylformylglycinamidine synthase subunit PurS [Verrucomicrobia bacterium]|nr:phosphoribosylformylglycinamidine synthase subunit PurS [Verrucomicrobiota bacterium]